MKHAKIVQVIETTIEVRGIGHRDEPWRVVTQYWSFDGNLLAENDPHLTGRGERITLAPEANTCPDKKE